MPIFYKPGKASLCRFAQHNMGKARTFQGYFQLPGGVEPHPLDHVGPFFVPRLFAVQLVADQKAAAGFQHPVHLGEGFADVGPEVNSLILFPD